MKFILRQKIPPFIPLIILLISFWFPLLIWFFNLKSLNITVIWKIDPIFFLITLRTIGFSFIITLLSLLIAYPLAIIWLFSSNNIKHALYIFFVFPLLMGLLARNYSWIGLLSGKSLFSFSFPLLKASSILYTEKAVVGVMVYIFIPFVFYALTYGLLSVKEEHIEAGRILGANIFQIIIYIVLPLSQRAALLAGFFVFISSVGYFVTPFMLGGGKYDFVGNLILAISNYGLFDEASKFAIAFFIILIPFYVLFMYFIIRRKEEILGK